MDKKPLIYIASPYTKGDTILNIRSSLEDFASILNDGKVTPIAPLLVFQAHLVHPRKEDDWMNYDLEILSHCDAVLATDAYYEDKNISYEQVDSYGRSIEINFATKNNIPVFWDLHGLYEYFHV